MHDPTHGDQRQGGHAEEQDPEGEQQLHRPIEQLPRYPPLEPDPGAVAQPHLDEESAGHGVGPMRHGGGRVPHARPGMVIRGARHDDARERHADLLALTEALLRLPADQLGAHGAGVVRGRLRGAIGEPDTGLEAEQ